MAMVLILLGLSIFFFFLIPKFKKGRGIPHPPGPPGLPFIGNLHQLDNSAFHSYLWKLSKKYGPIMSMQLGFIPTIVVSSAKMAREVMKKQDLAFCNRPILLGQQKLSYNRSDVAFAPYDDYWREMKKICVLHLFSSKRVQSFSPIRQDEVSRMINKISQLAVSCKLVNLNETLSTLTSTIICRVGFGKRYDDEGLERRRFYKLLNETQAMFSSFYVSDHFPVMGWLDNLTGLCARLEKNFKDMDMFYQELIDEHLSPNRPNSTQEDIIDILLQLRKDQLLSSFDLSLDHIKAVLMNVFVGGTDTTSSALVWAMTMLMQNPTVLKKLQEEIRTLVGKKGRVDEEDLQKLPYLKAAVKETMRLYPPVPLLVPRETMERCVLDGYEIQPKTLVYVNAYAIGRDPEFWENPEEFWPERFLGSTIDFRGQDFGLIPFGAGRRGCPALNMGAATVELALANLVYSFNWELPDGMKQEDIDMDSFPGLAMQKKNPLCLLPKQFIMGK